jgi:excisionase family DNA binding protein
MLYDVPAVARELGGISTAMVRRLIRTRQLGAVRVGYRVMVSRAQLEEYIARRSRPADPSRPANLGGAGAKVPEEALP